MFSNKIFIYLIALLVVGTSCKSVRKINNTDNSTNTTSRKKAKRKVEFIDGIEVTPGTVIKSKHKPSTTKQANEIVILTNIPVNAKSNIESANSLQVKYALLLDTYVENLNNKQLLSLIDEWWGTKYCYGGTTKSCIDCSGFTSVLFKALYNIDLPRTAYEQYNRCNKIDKTELMEGDLVFFSTRGGISHVGFYICNNKFVHASTGSGVMISDLDDRYWGRRFSGCGRLQ